jgi:hypothetical protein
MALLIVFLDHFKPTLDIIKRKNKRVHRHVAKENKSRGRK